MRNFVLPIVLLLSSTAFATRVFIDTPKISESEPSQATVTELLRSAVAQSGNEAVASESQAECTLKSNILRLGTSYIFTLEKVIGGKVAFQNKLKARELEELDDISVRLVRSVMNERDVSSDIKVSEVTVDESIAGSRRRESRTGNFAASGFAFTTGLRSPGFHLYLSLGKGWAVGPIVVGARWDFAINPNRHEGTGVFTDGTVNFSYYFLETDTSPYLTAELGYGLVREGFTGSLYGGMVLGGVAGVSFFRTHEVPVELGIRVATLTGAASDIAPVLMALRIGVAF